MSVLSRQSIRALSETENGLVDLATCPDFEQQLQPNGIDLTVASVEMVGGVSMGSGQLGVDDEARRLPGYDKLEPARDGYWTLYGNQSYIVTTNEVVSLPPSIMALVKPRSSLIRMGGNLNTAVWDAGFHGHSKFLLTLAPGTYSIRLQQNARFAQMVFWTLDASTEKGYDGVYQEGAAGHSPVSYAAETQGVLGKDAMHVKEFWHPAEPPRVSYVETPIAFDRQIGIIPEEAGHEIWQLQVHRPTNATEPPKQFDRVTYHSAGQAFSTKLTEAGRRAIALTEESVNAFLRWSNGDDEEWEVRDLQTIEGDDYRMRLWIERLEDEDPAVAQNHARDKWTGDGQQIRQLQLQLSHPNLSAIPAGTEVTYFDSTQTLESQIPAGGNHTYDLYLRLADAAAAFIRAIVTKDGEAPMPSWIPLTLAENYQHAVLVEAMVPVEAAA